MSVARRLGLGLAVLLIAGVVPPAHSNAAAALSSKECSAKYRAAKAAGTLQGRSYKAFRAAECGGATAAPAAKPPAAAGNAVFPSAISAKYSGESAAKARLHTCLDQYKANKARNANGGLKWIQKGGGYYSICNARLKQR
jgi:hypothetical protein